MAMKEFSPPLSHIRNGRQFVSAVRDCISGRPSLFYKSRGS